MCSHNHQQLRLSLEHQLPNAQNLVVTRCNFRARK